MEITHLQTDMGQKEIKIVNVFFIKWKWNQSKIQDSAVAVSRGKLIALNVFISRKSLKRNKQVHKVVFVHSRRNR